MGPGDDGGVGPTGTGSGGDDAIGNGGWGTGHGEVPRVPAGRYELGEVIGAGASRVVYRARDLQAGRVAVAVELFRQIISPTLARRQRDEAALLAPGPVSSSA